MARYGISLDDEMATVLDTRYTSKGDAKRGLAALAEPDAFIVRFDKGKPYRVGRQPMIRCIGLSGDIETCTWSDALKVYRGVRDIADTLPIPAPIYKGDSVRALYESLGVTTAVYYGLVKRLAEREAYAEAHKYDRIEAEYDAQWETYDTEQAAGRAMLKRIELARENGDPMPSNALPVLIAMRDGKPPEMPDHEAYARLWYSGKGAIFQLLNTPNTAPKDPLIGRGTPIRCGEKRKARLEADAIRAAAERAERERTINRMIGLRNAEYCLRRAGLATVPKEPRMTHIAIMHGMIPQI